MLIDALRPLLNTQTATLNLVLSKATNDEFTLVVQPVAISSDHDDAELQTLRAALSLPFKITGRLEETETALAARIQQAAPQRDQWSAQIEAVEAALASAREAKAAQAAKTKKGAGKQPGTGTQTAAAKPPPAEPETTSDDDFEL